MKFHEMLRKKSSQIPSTKVGIPRYSAGIVLMVKPLVGALRPCACPAGQLVGELVERLWLGSIPKCLKCLTLWICLVYKHGNRKVPCLVGKSLNVHCRARSQNYEFYLCSTIYQGWWSSMPDILSISFVHTRKPSQNIHRHTKSWIASWSSASSFLPNILLLQLELLQWQCWQYWLGLELNQAWQRQWSQDISSSQHMFQSRSLLLGQNLRSLTSFQPACHPKHSARINWCRSCEN